MTWNFTDRIYYVLSTDSNKNNCIADHSLTFMKEWLVEGGLFGEMAWNILENLKVQDTN